jgi:SdpC family antimicrobial peptide
MDSSQSDESEVSASSPTGEDLFRGILFGEGNVAAKLPELWASTSVRDSIQLSETKGTTRGEAAQQIESLADYMTQLGLPAAQVQDVRDKAATLLAGGPASEQISASVLPSSQQMAAARDTIVKSIGTSDPTFFANFRKAIQSGNPVEISAMLDQCGAKIAAATSSFRTPGSASAFGTGTDTDSNVAVAVVVAVAVAVVVAVAVALVVAVVVGPVAVKRFAGTLPREQLVSTLASRFAN